MNKLNKTRIKLSATIFALVIVSVLGISLAVKAGNTFDWGNVEDKVADKLATQVSLQEPVQEQKLGALTGPDIPYPYFSFGDVRSWANAKSLVTATTTICALQSPTATSSLEFGSLNLDTSSTTASLITIAKSATAFATTTIIGNQYNVGANAQAAIIASSTPSAENLTFAPSQWLVFGMQGGTGTMSPTGKCQAIWRQVSN